MLFKGMRTGPDRESYLSVGGKLWMPAGRGLFRPSWGDLLKLSWLKLCGMEIVSTPPVIAGGSGFSGGGGGGGGTEQIVLNLQGAAGGALASNTSYEINSAAASTPRQNPPRHAIPVPVTSTLTGHYWAAHNNTTSPSNENGVRVFACKNNNTDTAGGATAPWNGTIPFVVKGSETGLSVAYTAGDTIQPCLQTPVWGTAAAGVRISWAAIFTVP